MAYLAYAVLWTLQRTLRVRVVGGEHLDGGGPAVFAFWHGEQQLVLVRRPTGRFVVMTSASRDGQLQASILRRFEVECVTGSSSRRGASGLLGLVRAVRSGGHAGVAVDGPRGPCYQAKGGVVQLARSSGRPIVPVRARASRFWVVPGTWDAFVVPFPFTRVEITFLPALSVPRRATRAELEACRSALDAALGAGVPARVEPGGSVRTVEGAETAPSRGASAG